jgi:hypothetical protein
MTLNKKRYFRKKSNAVYTLILFDFKVIKHVINIFLFPQKKIKTIYKKQVATMQPLSTFPSKGSESIFNCKKISRKDMFKTYIYLQNIWHKYDAKLNVSKNVTCNLLK